MQPWLPAIFNSFCISWHYVHHKWCPLKGVLPTTAGNRKGELPTHVSCKVVQSLWAWGPFRPGLTTWNNKALCHAPFLSVAQSMSAPMMFSPGETKCSFISLYEWRLPSTEGFRTHLPRARYWRRDFEVNDLALWTLGHWHSKPNGSAETCFWGSKVGKRLKLKR